MNVRNVLSELGVEFTRDLGSVQLWLQIGRLQIPIHKGTVDRWSSELGVWTLGFGAEISRDV